MFQTSIYSFYGIIERLETKILYTCTHLQLTKLQNQPQEVSWSALSLAESTCFNFDLYTIKVTMVVSSDIDPESSSINNQMRFIILISCDLEPDITSKSKISVISVYRKTSHMINMEICHQLMSRPWKIVTSAGLSPGKEIYCILL